MHLELLTCLQCTESWEGPTCEVDVNECYQFAGTDLGCQNGASCQNLPGTYRLETKYIWCIGVPVEYKNLMRFYAIIDIFQFKTIKL